MKYEKVLLINPSYRSAYFTAPVTPVGMGYLAEFLKRGGVDYSIFDMALGYNLRDLKKRISVWKPDLIGISMMSIMYKSHYETVKFIKGLFPEIPIVVGGPHISSCREEVLRDCQEIDFGILQEGEKPLLSLCEGKKHENIPGLLYRKDNAVMCTGEGTEVEDLDELPFPRYEKFELDKYTFGICMLSSRGCPFRCVYCSAHVMRKRFRARSAVSVAEEMEYWYKLGYREFDMQEDNPSHDKNRMYELCDEIEKRGLTDAIIMCGNGVRADKIDKQLLKRMREVGFNRIGFGVEGGNDKVLKSIKKGQTIDVVKSAIKDACDLGFFVSLFFIVGSPSETVEDVEDSIKIATSYPISHVNFFNMIPLPATELYKWVRANDYFIVDPDNYLNMCTDLQMKARPVFETPEFTAADRVRMLEKGKRIERIVKRRAIANRLDAIRPLNKLVAWFYTLYWIQRIESKLMYFGIYRKTIGAVKAKIRLYCYKKQ